MNEVRVKLKIYMVLFVQTIRDYPLIDLYVIDSGITLFAFIYFVR